MVPAASTMPSSLSRTNPIKCSLRYSSLHFQMPILYHLAKLWSNKRHKSLHYHRMTQKLNSHHGQMAAAQQYHTAIRSSARSQRKQQLPWSKKKRVWSISRGTTHITTKFGGTTKTRRCTSIRILETRSKLLTTIGSSAKIIRMERFRLISWTTKDRNLHCMVFHSNQNSETCRKNGQARWKLKSTSSTRLGTRWRERRKRKRASSSFSSRRLCSLPNFAQTNSWKKRQKRRWTGWPRNSAESVKSIQL